MTALPYRLTEDTGPRLGLIVLQADETLERDLRRLLPPQATPLVSRVPSATDVSLDSLQEIGTHLSAAAALFPAGQRLQVVGYGCTSGSAQLTPQGVAARVAAGCAAQAITQPLSALVAACRALRVRRLALLSPYVRPVSARLQAALAAEGIDTPVFGSFEVAEEARVARISTASTIAAAQALLADAGQAADVDGLFLSCTNLPTLDAIGPLEDALNLPVLSSNLVLGWHMATLAGVAAGPDAPGRLFQRCPPGQGAAA